MSNAEAAATPVCVLMERKCFGSSYHQKKRNESVCFCEYKDGAVEGEMNHYFSKLQNKFDSVLC